MLYQDHLASVRKDVEAFGIEKQHRVLPYLSGWDGMTAKRSSDLHDYTQHATCRGWFGLYRRLDGDWLTKDVNAYLENNRGGVCLHSAAFNTGDG